MSDIFPKIEIDNMKCGCTTLRSTADILRLCQTHEEMLCEEWEVESESKEQTGRPDGYAALRMIDALKEEIKTLKASVLACMAP